MLADMLGLPHQDRDLGLARHHAAIDADIHHAGVVVLGDAAAIGKEIAPAVEPVPPRRRKLVEVDVVAGDDVLLHRAGGDDLRGNAAAEHVAAELHEFARMGVGRDAEHHGDAPIARQPAAEHPAAPGIGAIVLDVVEQQRRAVAGALGEPHDGADLDIPVDLRVDLLDLAGVVERLDPAAEIAIGDRLAFDVHCLFQFVLPGWGRSWGRSYARAWPPHQHERPARTASSVNGRLAAGMPLLGGCLRLARSGCRSTRSCAGSRCSGVITRRRWKVFDGALVSQLGLPLVRKEDPALLSGRGRYGDDLPEPRGTLHAHVIRSPHAHANIRRIDAAAAQALPGVVAVITGEDVRKLTDPFLIALKQPVHQWSLAVGLVRYVGEAVALVVAADRYIAEDAAELVVVDYEPLAAVIDPIAACDRSAPLLHPECKTNEISVRRFSYGDTAAAFAAADARVALTVDYPRLSFTPMECYVVVAEYRPHDKSYDVMANFQGPFSTHPVMAKALRVPGTKMRLRIPPDSGGSFGIKLSVFPYIVLDRDRREDHRAAGEVGRGPGRAPRRRELGTRTASPRSRPP